VADLAELIEPRYRSAPMTMIASGSQRVGFAWQSAHCARSGRRPAGEARDVHAEVAHGGPQRRAAHRPSLAGRAAIRLLASVGMQAAGLIAWALERTDRRRAVERRDLNVPPGRAARAHPDDTAAGLGVAILRSVGHR
jgi:hypothetical protein